MRILLMEDDLTLATFLRRSLEQQGYSVDHATNGEEGVMLAAEERADLILLDLNLPRLDGTQVLRQLRLGGVRTPVLVLTGRGGVEDRVKCLDSGADDFLAKPFSFLELAARCRAMLRRKSAPSEAAVVRHGGLQVNRLERSVSLHGEEVLLTSKEFALLDYLLQHRERPVSRPELLEKVWRMAPDAGTNVVDVYVNYLRRKLRTSETEAEWIVTVRGSGYMLAPAAGLFAGGGLPPKKPVMLQRVASSRTAVAA